jgi:hypothetical protein
MSWHKGGVTTETRPGITSAEITSTKIASTKIASTKIASTKIASTKIASTKINGRFVSQQNGNVIPYRVNPPALLAL